MLRSKDAHRYTEERNPKQNQRIHLMIAIRKTYRVTHQVVPNGLLTSKQRLRFSICSLTKTQLFGAGTAPPPGKRIRGKVRETRPQIRKCRRNQKPAWISQSLLSAENFGYSDTG